MFLDLDLFCQDVISDFLAIASKVRPLGESEPTLPNMHSNPITPRGK